ncbi:MAG: ABC transporter ATP-binding protein [Hyphomicrobium zavarzinii]|jgi:branched-chain amino acid transport system ATP-binding protein|uniref:ABC transporter ATP-binding protein n=1 Tax=Hyphomicrobium TaxID=81 RepID=UPI001A58B8E1|nr:MULTISPECIES: ABC transporter ATP-binding protein [Hyphomicrobium]MBL8846207.1 ABC transporter ATP-binding protein [Hyphomicrobium zavarzinii]WBT38453.1 ABC transporter ATP-binding protein [Hyphomicrobium sp. DMF-1]HML41784.1 ABC transporter ATP-binding protein [Hyphomicrobium zavarzinii]
MGDTQERRDDAAPDVRVSGLVVSGVRKSFGGLKVLRGVDLDCGVGEIVGLIGPNGAGKSTLINAITSLMQVDEGEVTIAGRRVSNTSPQLCMSAGLARTFQNIKLFTRLTVRQNIEVALTSGQRDRAEQTAAIDVGELLAWFELERIQHWKAGALSYGNQRRLEIARALALGPSFLLLDEPAAGMNAVETTALISAVKGIRDRFGCGVVVIDHDLRFIMTLCQRIFVLDAGEIVASGLPEEIRRNPRVIEVYIGHERSKKHAGS